MRKIKVINPAIQIPKDYTDTWMNYLTKYIRKDTYIEFDAITEGFASVETEAQDLINGAEILKRIAASQDEGWDGIFVNCFDDPAVIAGREISKIPVLGPYEPAVLFGSLLSEKIAIISTDQYGLLCEERKSFVHRTSQRIAKILNVGLTVLELEDEKTLKTALTDCCKRLEEENIHAAVLGCTGMNYIVDSVQADLNQNGIHVQLVEPLRVGLTTLEYMIYQGYTNLIYHAPVNFEDLH